jgi:hypothetical protein
MVGFEKAVRNKLNILPGPVGFQLLRPGGLVECKSDIKPTLAF